MYLRNLPKLYRTTRHFTSSSWCSMTFEGNSHAIEGTPEQRMSTVFGGRIKGEPPESTSRILKGGSKIIAGIVVPSKPIEPDNCCMSGCVNCVWEIFSEDLREWRSKRKSAAQRIKDTDEIWPAHWNPPLALLDLRNVPKALKNEKINRDKHLQENRAKSTASLFPVRTEPLPKSVLDAKRRNSLHKREEKADSEAEDRTVDEDQDGWSEIPVYIRAFAEFERKKKLLKQKNAIKT